MNHPPTQFSLAAGVVPNGDILVAEVLATTGIDIGRAYIFVPPNTIEVATKVVGTKKSEIQAAVNAHKGTPITDVKARALLKVDREAENYRLKFVTAGEAMQAVYRLKDDEVKLYRKDEAAGTIDTTGARYPVINSEVGITAGTLAEVVTLVEKRIADWTTIAATSEALRQQAKKNIKAATTVADIEAAANVAWP